MKSSRFSQEQIIGILKQGEAGVKVTIYAASMASPIIPFDRLRTGSTTVGSPNLGEWRSRRPRGSKPWRRRTAS